jgi:hypothetical protein
VAVLSCQDGARGWVFVLFFVSFGVCMQLRKYNNMLGPGADVKYTHPLSRQLTCTCRSFVPAGLAHHRELVRTTQLSKSMNFCLNQRNARQSCRSCVSSGKVMGAMA